MKIKKYQNASSKLDFNTIQVDFPTPQEALEESTKEALDFYDNDVVPRRNRERSEIENSLMTKNIQSVRKVPMYIGDRNTSTQVQKQWNSGSSVSGFYDPTSNSIYYNPREFKWGSNDNTVGLVTHELTHADQYGEKLSPYLWLPQILIRKVPGITRKEYNYLNKAYQSNNEGSSDIYEKQATNRQVRNALYSRFKKTYNREPNSLQEFDEFIKNSSDKTINDLLKYSNEYGYDYTDSPTFDINAVKEALIKVAYNDKNSQIQYAKQGIHIKEKNKGSFTKYCKGKVTEECIRKGKNSPNPKIRKKATFAANARKWKHQNGGVINYINLF